MFEYIRKIFLGKKVNFCDREFNLIKTIRIHNNIMLPNHGDIIHIYDVKNYYSVVKKFFYYGNDEIWIVVDIIKDE